MKLDKNGIRDVLLKIEELHQLTEDHAGEVEFELLTFDELSSTLPTYDTCSLYYVLFQLDAGGYIKACTDVGNDRLVIYGVEYMTYKGHEFLESVRSPQQWQSVKAVAHAVGNCSLAAISAAAEGLTSAGINALLSGRSDLL